MSLASESIVDLACIDHGQVGDKDGYGKTVRHIEGQRRYMRLHRAVFLDNNGYLPQVVRHTCDNPRCVNPAHLIPGTVADNNRDRAERGRNADVRGVLNPRCKLSDGEVAAIRESTETAAVLAAQYGVSVRHIYKLKAGERR